MRTKVAKRSFDGMRQIAHDFCVAPFHSGGQFVEHFWRRLQEDFGQFLQEITVTIDLLQRGVSIIDHVPNVGSSRTVQSGITTVILLQKSKGSGLIDFSTASLWRP